MQITYATEAAPGCVNEDRAVCGDGWAVVLDGATAPEGVDSGCIHDVSWLVNHLAAGITRGLLLGFVDLADVLGLAIAETCRAHAGTCDLANPDSPSSTAAIVRVRGGVLDYLVLADSPVVVRAPGEAPKVFSDDRLSHLPGGRPYSRELVRYMRNKPEGFWVASTDPEAAYRAVTGSMLLAPGSEVGLFTDGVSRLVDIYGYGWDVVLTVAGGRSGPANLISALRSLEADNPPEGGKKHDDATAVLMTGDCVEGGNSPSVRPANWRDLVGL